MGNTKQDVHVYRISTVFNLRVYVLPGNRYLYQASKVLQIFRNFGPNFFLDDVLGAKAEWVQWLLVLLWILSLDPSVAINATICYIQITETGTTARPGVAQWLGRSCKVKKVRVQLLVPHEKSFGLFSLVRKRCTLWHKGAPCDQKVHSLNKRCTLWHKGALFDTKVLKNFELSGRCTFHMTNVRGAPLKERC